MAFLERIAGLVRHQAQWRCAEPVVVIESDDWGLERKPCWELAREAGEPTDWALEASETAEDVERLSQLLARHRDETGRPACFTANFIVSNPDYEAIRKSSFEQWSDVPLRQWAADTVQRAYRAAIEEGTLYPQYHGLRHYNATLLLTDVRANAAARKCFDSGCAAALSFAKGHLWRYHSEYADWSRGGAADPAALQAMVETGAAYFEDMFGFRPLSTIPPHYVVSEAGLAAWKTAGIRYVQGTNYQIHPGPGGRKVIRRQPLGRADAATGLISISRNVKFEPRPGRKETADSAIAQAKQMIEARIPAMIDTHRINYTGQFREAGLRDLERLLQALEVYRPRYLTTAELGQAIEFGGRYRDRVTGEERTLRPQQSLVRSIAIRLA